MSDDEIEGLEALVEALTGKNKQLYENYDKINQKYQALKSQQGQQAAYPHSQDQAQIKHQIQLNSLNQQIKYMGYQLAQYNEYIEQLELAKQYSENELRQATERCRMQQLYLAAYTQYFKSLEDSEAAGQEKDQEIAMLNQQIQYWTILNDRNNQKIQDLEIANQQLRTLVQKSDCRNHVDRALVQSILRQIGQQGERMVLEPLVERWRDMLKVCLELIY